DLVLRSLHGDVVRDAVLRVEPEVRSCLEAGAERDEHVVGDISLRRSHLLDSHPVDIVLKARLIELLLNMHIDGARYGAHLLCDLRSGFEIVGHIGSDGLNIDRSGDTEVERLGDDAGRLEKERYAGKVPGQLLSQA